MVSHDEIDVPRGVQSNLENFCLYGPQLSIRTQTGAASIWGAGCFIDNDIRSHNSTLIQ